MFRNNHDSIQVLEQSPFDHDSAGDWILARGTHERGASGGGIPQRHISERASPQQQSARIGAGAVAGEIPLPNGLSPLHWFLLEPRNRIYIDGFGVVVASDGEVRSVAAIPEMSNNDHSQQVRSLVVCVGASDGTFVQRVLPGTGQSTLLFCSPEPSLLVAPRMNNSNDNGSRLDEVATTDNVSQIVSVQDSGDGFVVELASTPPHVVHREAGSTLVSKMTPGWLASTLSYVPLYGTLLKEAVTAEQASLTCAASPASGVFAVLRESKIQVWSSSSKECSEAKQQKAKPLLRVVAEHTLEKPELLGGITHETIAQLQRQNQAHMAESYADDDIFHSAQEWLAASVPPSAMALSHCGKYLAVARRDFFFALPSVYVEQGDYEQQEAVIDTAQQSQDGKRNQSSRQQQENDGGDSSLFRMHPLDGGSDSQGARVAPPSAAIAAASRSTRIDVYELVPQTGVFDRPLSLIHRSVFRVPLVNVTLISLLSPATVVACNLRRICVGALRRSFVHGGSNSNCGSSQAAVVCAATVDGGKSTITSATPLTKRTQLLLTASLPHDAILLSRCAAETPVADIFRVVQQQQKQNSNDHHRQSGSNPSCYMDDYDDEEDDAGCSVRVLDMKCVTTIDFAGRPAAALRRFNRLHRFFRPEEPQRQQQQEQTQLCGGDDNDVAGPFGNCGCSEQLRIVQFFGHCFRALVFPAPEQQQQRQVNNNNRNDNDSDDDAGAQREGSPDAASATASTASNSNSRGKSRAPASSPEAACQLLLRSIAAMRVEHKSRGSSRQLYSTDVSVPLRFFRTAMVPTFQQRADQQHVVQIDLSIVACAIHREFSQVEGVLVAFAKQVLHQQQQQQRGGVGTSSYNDDLATAAVPRYLTSLREYCRELVSLCVNDIGAAWFDPGEAARYDEELLSPRSGLVLEDRLALDGTILLRGRVLTARDEAEVPAPLQAGAPVAVAINTRGSSGRGLRTIGEVEATTIQCLFLADTVHRRADNLIRCLAAVEALGALTRRINVAAVPRMIEHSTTTELPALMRAALVNFKSPSPKRSNANSSSSRGNVFSAQHFAESQPARDQLRHLLSEIGRVELQIWELLLTEKYSEALDMTRQHVLELFLAGIKHHSSAQQQQQQQQDDVANNGDDDAISLAPLDALTMRFSSLVGVDDDKIRFAELAITIALCQRRAPGGQRGVARGLLVAALERAATIAHKRSIMNQRQQQQSGLAVVGGAEANDDPEDAKGADNNSTNNACFAQLRPFLQEIWSTLDGPDATACFVWLAQPGHHVNSTALSIAAGAQPATVRPLLEQVFSSSSQSFSPNSSSINNHGNGLMGPLSPSPAGNSIGGGLDSSNVNVSPHLAWWLACHERHAQAAAMLQAIVCNTGGKPPMHISTRRYLARRAAQCDATNIKKQVDELDRRQQQRSSSSNISHNRGHGGGSTSSSSMQLLQMLLHDEAPTRSVALVNHVLAQENLLRVLMAVLARGTGSGGGGGGRGQRAVAAAAAVNPAWFGGDVERNGVAFAHEMEHVALLPLPVLISWCSEHLAVPGVGAACLVILMANQSWMQHVAVHSALSIQQQQLQQQHQSQHDLSTLHTFSSGNSSLAAFGEQFDAVEQHQQILADIQQRDTIGANEAWCAAFEAAVVNPLEESNLSSLQRCVDVVNSLSGKRHGVSAPFIASFVEAVEPSSTARCSAYVRMGIPAPIVVDSMLALVDRSAAAAAAAAASTTATGNQQPVDAAAAAAVATAALAPPDSASGGAAAASSTTGLSDAFSSIRISAAELLLRAARYFVDLAESAAMDPEAMRRSFSALDARVKKMYANARTGAKATSAAERNCLEEANRILAVTESSLMQLDPLGRQQSFVF